MITYIGNPDEAARNLSVSFIRLLDSKSIHKIQIHFYITAINFKICKFLVL